MFNFGVSGQTFLSFFNAYPAEIQIGREHLKLHEYILIGQICF